MKEIFSQLKTLLKEDEHLLTNLNVSFKSGFDDKIDAVLISHKGIMCIKLFFLGDRLKGNDTDLVWLKMEDERCSSVPNPVLNNKLHCEIVSKALEHTYKVDNIVLLSIECNTELIHSTHAYTFFEFVPLYEARLDNVLSSEEIQKIYDILKRFKK